MKAMFASIAVVVSLALCTAAVLAAGGDKDKKGNGNNSQGNSQQNNQGQTNQNQNNSNQNNSNQKKQNQNQSNSSNNNNNNNNKNGNSSNNNSKNKMGSNNFDKNGIGSMDENAHKGEKDNKWRYNRYGNSWWYWRPEGYWCYYRNGDWCRYDVETYVDAAAGPYYQDQSGGFFHMQGNVKVADPDIRRMSMSGGMQPPPPQG